MLILDEKVIWSNFIDSLKSPETKKGYGYALKQFMAYHHLTDYSSLLVTREDKIKEYVIHLSNKGASKSQFTILFAALKNFYEMNDVENIRWHKLKRFVGEEQPQHEDRRYTNEEIHTLVQSANMKLKAMILLMASSGARVGALPGLCVDHLQKKDNLYKVNVYKGQKGKGQYYTFCTPEAAKAIDAYLDFRIRCGEKITPNSLLFRKDFDMDFHEEARNQIQPTTQGSICQAIARELVKTGIRTTDHVSHANRKQVKLTHGFRKFFETMLVNASLHETIIRKLTGHSDSTNLTQLYSKQTEAEMLSEYEKATDLLTIEPSNRLQRKVQVLEQEKNTLSRMALEIQEIKKQLRKSQR